MRIKQFDRSYNGIAIIIEDESGLVQVYLKCNRRTQHLINLRVADKPFDDVTEDDIDRYIEERSFLLNDLLDYISSFSPRRITYENEDLYDDEFDDDEFDDDETNGIGEYQDVEEKMKIRRVSFEWWKLKDDIINFGKYIENELGINYSERAKEELSTIFEEVKKIAD